MNNEPAFPTRDYDMHQNPITGQIFITGHRGLTKREYFAGLAMQAIRMSRDAIYGSKAEIKEAVQIADALIAELEKTK